MQIEVLPDSDAVAREAAKFITAEARAAIRARGRFLVAVSGGRVRQVRALVLADREAVSGLGSN